jgi:hypothetical protein
MKKITNKMKRRRTENQVRIWRAIFLKKIRIKESPRRRAR